MFNIIKFRFVTNRCLEAWRDIGHADVMRQKLGGSQIPVQPSHALNAVYRFAGIEAGKTD
jgi:hypothetical protein